MLRAHVLDRLVSNADKIRRFGVIALYLYGSTGRDQAGEGSDIDLFADVDYARFGFVEYMDIRLYLAEVLGRKVDFTTRAALHPDLRDRILRSAIKVFDDAALDPIAAE